MMDLLEEKQLKKCAENVDIDRDLVFDALIVGYKGILMVILYF